jgi:AraC-like DNA-binding protein
VHQLYIWENRVFYLGLLPDISEHRLGAAALCVSIDRSFRVLESESSSWRECRSVLIPPGCMHEIDIGGALLAILFLEPESDHYALLREAMAGGDWQCLYGLANEREVIAMFLDLYQQRQDAQTIYRLLDRIIDPRQVAPAVNCCLDARINRVIQLIKNDPSQSYSVEALADNVSLSPTRLVHLFKEQTGVPIRRFRQWNRMKSVVEFVAAGQTLTAAALNAGFSDSAHLSRAFRNMFGIKPSFLFSRSTNLNIVFG